ncbi:MAG: YkgJ family cysteine cluster protein [Syntrophotaleaceae bacterium]
MLLKSLESYRQLVARVDRFAHEVSERYPSQLACRRGCDACCTHIGVSAVEALALSLAVSSLPADEAAALRERAARMEAGDACPLLAEGICLLYQARPIICRTQGLPLLFSEEGGRLIDYCPLNFKGVETISGAAVLDLEALNQTLAAISLLCLQELAEQGIDLPERLPLAEALQLEIVFSD